MSEIWYFVGGFKNITVFKSCINVAFVALAMVFVFFVINNVFDLRKNFISCCGVGPG